jgi:chaperonin GroEL
MQPRRVKFGNEARMKLLSGLQLASRTVAPTLGPSGRLVIMDSRFGTPEVATSAIDKLFDSPVLGNDGCAIVSEIHTSDPFINQGVALAREAGRMTKRTAGDGSTAAIILTARLVGEGMTLIAAGFEPARLRVALEHAVEEALARLLALAVPVSDDRVIGQVALRASGGDVELAEAVGSAVALVGGDDVQVEQSKEAGVSVDVREGLRLERGAVSPYFLPAPERSQAVLVDCYVLIVDDKIGTARELLGVVDRVAATGRPLLVLAHELDADALAMLTVNTLNGRLKAVAVQAPAHGEARRTIMQDVAALTGGLVVGTGAGVSLRQLDLSYLGRAREVVVGRKSTTIVGCEGEQDGVRLRQLEVDLREAASVYDRDEIDRRRLQLTGKRFVVLKIGAHTDSEGQERVRRGEDALRASQEALAGGVVPGGGVALLRAGDGIASDGHDLYRRAAARALRRALEEPLRVLAANAGEDAARVVAQVRSLPTWHGFNIETRAYEDFSAGGILDSAPTVASALRNAAYMAGRAISSEVVVAQPLAGGRLRETADVGGPANLGMR